MRQVPKISNVLAFQSRKNHDCKISMVTCYDTPSAKIVEQSRIDVALVGDSVAMAVHGHATTVTATIEMMTLHTEAVARGLNKTFLVSDLPFLCHKAGLPQTIGHVKKLMQAGANALKIEGADHDTCQTISHIVTAGIPVMGHIGLTPQSINGLGGNVIQGKNESQQDKLIQDALKLQDAGCFAIVIECVPESLAKRITEKLSIPTIGIGAGRFTDGQVLVWHDLLGIQDEFKPKFLKTYLNAKKDFLEALNEYAEETASISFPTLKHIFEDLSCVS